MSVQPENKDSEADSAVRIRGFLLVIFVIGLLGAGTELLLLDHTEGFWQLVPLFLMTISLAVIGWCAVHHSYFHHSYYSMKAFQGTMILFLLSGFVGVGLHWKVNIDFELEMYPSMRGLQLLVKALSGATPVLAPGTMIGLGLLGLVYAYKHPDLAKSTKETTKI